MRGGEPLLRTREMVESRSIYGKAPTSQIHRTLIAVRRSAHTEEYVNSLKLSSMYVQVRLTSSFLARCSSPFNATRRTPHGPSRLVLTMPAWPVKPRRAPPRHCRSARVYGHTTTAMHEIEHTPPPAPPDPLPNPPSSDRLEAPWEASRYTSQSCTQCE